MRSAQLGALALAAACALACGPRYARVPLVQTPELAVTLRAEKRGGGPVARGFAQPTTIPAARIESILSRIEVRTGGGKTDERRAAFAGELLPTLASALSDALARADATQEVVIRAERRERKLGVFSRRFATSFVAWVDTENRLELHLVDADREVPAGDDAPLPEPVVGQSTQTFKALPGPHVAAIGPRDLAVDWRADLFTSAPLRGQGARKRTILLGAPDAALGAAPPSSSGDGAPASDPDRARALAELDAARRAGRISEAEYQRRRAELLQPARN